MPKKKEKEKNLRRCRAAGRRRRLCANSARPTRPSRWNNWRRGCAAKSATATTPDRRRRRRRRRRDGRAATSTSRRRGGRAASAATATAGRCPPLRRPFRNNLHPKTNEYQSFRATAAKKETLWPISFETLCKETFFDDILVELVDMETPFFFWRPFFRYVNVHTGSSYSTLPFRYTKEFFFYPNGLSHSKRCSEGEIRATPRKSSRSWVHRSVATLRFRPIENIARSHRDDRIDEAFFFKGKHKAISIGTR